MKPVVVDMLQLYSDFRIIKAVKKNIMEGIEQRLERNALDTILSSSTRRNIQKKWHELIRLVYEDPVSTEMTMMLRYVHYVKNVISLMDEIHSRWTS